MTTTLQIGRYDILGTLGSGASSRVDKARDTVIGRTVALKTFIHGIGQGCEQQFLREAQIVGQLSHPSIVQLYDAGTDEHGTAHLVMEYVAGNTLEHLLTQSAVPLQRACAWAADLANALATAHRAGIIHGDVKPANMFVTEDSKVKLGDFGIARFATQVSGSGRVMGTPAYLSPEQIQGEKQDQRSDLFSLGVVLYEMVTGVRPFAGTSLPAVCAQILEASPLPPSKCNPDLPASIDRILARCLAKNPQERYQAGEELARELYVLARSGSQLALPRQSPWLLRPLQPRDFWAVAALLLAVTTGATAVHSLRQRLRISPLPAFVAAAPSAPADLFGYTQTQVMPLDEDASSPTAGATPETVKRPTQRLSSKSKSKTAPAGEKVVQDPSHAVSLTASVPASAMPDRAPADVGRAALQIAIASSSSDGTLAIFADQELLFATQLHVSTAAAPLQLERALPAGSHQLRVALYRSDKSLQVEREGLTDLRADCSNILEIRVSRRKKLLLRRENSLEVTWPSAPASAAEHTWTPLLSSSVSMK